MRRWVYFGLLLLWPNVLLAMQSPAYFSALTMKPTRQSTRLTFILSKKTIGRIRYRAHPHRVIVELANTRPAFHFIPPRFSASNVQSMTSRTVKPGDMQFIFYMRSKTTWSIHFLPQQKGTSTRLELLLQSMPDKKLPLAAKPAPANTPFSQEKNARPLKTIFQKELMTTFAKLAAPMAVKPIFTVVIDAGHGGKDPGAIGLKQTQEKKIVFDIAQGLAKAINQTPNMRAVLTRNGDYYVPLRQRLARARADNADIFIAIHADAYFNNIASGASVFALSARGASNEAARWLAQQNNDAELGEVAFNRLRDRSPLLRSVLIDLAQTATINDSLRLGNFILNALDTITSLHHGQVEQAPFVVLKSPDIPSILVEVGFISNPHEEQRLNHFAYQEKIVHDLWRGIYQYQQYQAAKEAH